MHTQNVRLRILGLLIFIIGFLLGIVFWGGTVWADFEASLFDRAISSDETLKTLSCPLMISRGESAMVAITLSNSLDRVIKPRVRVHVSDGHVTLMREIDEQLSINPGEKQVFQWEVNPDDAVYNLFILNRVFVFPVYPIPSQGGTCGIIVMSLANLSGNQIVVVILTVSLLCMGVGLGLWMSHYKRQSDQPLEPTRALFILAILMIIGITFNILGWWVLSGFLFLITILLIVAMVGYFVRSA